MWCYKTLGFCEACNIEKDKHNIGIFDNTQMELWECSVRDCSCMKVFTLNDDEECYLFSPYLIVPFWKWVLHSINMLPIDSMSIFLSKWT